MAEEEKLDSLIEIIRHRRSVRKYDPEPLTAGMIEPAIEAAIRTPLISKSPSWNIHVFTEPKLRDRIKRAAQAGIRGKINTWLGSNDIPAMVCVTARADSGLRIGDKPFYLLESAMAFEYFVLGARAAGLGTCWIGAFEENPVAHALELDSCCRIVTVSPIGKPYARPLKPLDINGQYDRIARRRLHEQRKPLNDIAFCETFGQRKDPPFEPLLETLAGRRSEGLEAAKITSSLLGDVHFPTCFADKDVSDQQVAWLLEAARLAPSASNSQTWRFVVIRDDDRLAELESCAHNESGMQAPFSKAPVVIAAVADQWIIKERGSEQPYFMIDIPIALSHIILMASELGLETNVSLEFNENRVRKIIKAPMMSRVVALVSVGYAPARGKQGDLPRNMTAQSRPSRKSIEIL